MTSKSWLSETSVVDVTFSSFLTLTLSFRRTYRFNFFHQPPNRIFLRCKGVLDKKGNSFASSTILHNVQIFEQYLEGWFISNGKLNFRTNETLAFFRQYIHPRNITYLQEVLVRRIISLRLAKNFRKSKSSLAHTGIGFSWCSDWYFSPFKGFLFSIKLSVKSIALVI